MKKLSPSQRAVLELLVEGWALGMVNLSDGTPWMQKNGLGRGGPRLSVHTNTLNALEARGYIKRNPMVRYPFIPFSITEAGRKALESAKGYSLDQGGTT